MKSPFGMVLTAVWAGLVLTVTAADAPFAVSARLERAAATAVAVSEFSVVNAPGINADWTGRGVPDLLQIQLQHSGVAVVDRDLIAAMLREQRLQVADSVVDRMELGRMVGASVIVHGSVTMHDATRVRLEAAAVRVPANESLAVCAAEGAYPQELPRLIEKLAAELAVRILQRPVVEPASPAHQTAGPSPEALTLFYTGISLFGRGFPEAGAAWFGWARALDPKFVAAREWEIKAYREAGFAEHAAIAARLRGARGPADAAVASAARKVVVVAPPMIATPGAAPVGFDPAALSLALRQAVVGSRSARLFDADQIGTIAAELDLQIGEGFAASELPRYDRWLAVNGLALARLTPMAEAKGRLRLDLVNPMSGDSELAGEVECALSEAPQAGKALLARLLQQWTQGLRKVRPLPAGEGAPPKDLGPLKAETAAANARLAGLLNERRCGGDVCRALAEAYVGLGELEHAAAEMRNAVVACEGGRQPQRGLALYQLRTWMTRWSLKEVLAREPSLVGRLADRIVSDDPGSLAAGMIHYSRGLEAFNARAWPKAAVELQAAREALEGAPVPRYPDHFRSGMLSACYYMAACAAVEQGQAASSNWLVRAETLTEAIPPIDPTMGIMSGDTVPIITSGGVSEPGAKSVAVLVRELRQRLSGDAGAGNDWVRRMAAGKEREVLEAFLMALCSSVEPLNMIEFNPRTNRKMAREFYEICYARSAETAANAANEFVPVFDSVLATWRNGPAESDHLAENVPGYLFVKGVLAFFRPGEVPLGELADRAVAAFKVRRAIAQLPVKIMPASEEKVIRWHRQAADLYTAAGLQSRKNAVFAPLIQCELSLNALTQILPEVPFNAETWDRNLRDRLGLLLGGTSAVPTAVSLWIAEGLVTSGRHKESVEWFSRARPAGGGPQGAAAARGLVVSLMQQGRTNEIGRLLAGMNPDELFAACGELAALARTAHDYPAEAAYLQNGLTTGKGDEGTVRALAFALANSGNEKELAQLQIKQGAGAARNWYLLARSRQMAGDMARAAAYFDRIPKEVRDLWLNGLYRAAECYEVLGRKELQAERLRSLAFAVSADEEVMLYMEYNPMPHGQLSTSGTNLRMGKVAQEKLDQLRASGGARP